jgi:subtilase family serine protease
VVRNRIAVVAALVGVVLAGVLASGTAAASASRAKRVAAELLLPRGARAIGSVSRSAELQLTVALTPSDPSGLAAFATAVATPGNADYHHYLTVSQFAQLFGAPRATQLAVIAALRAQGLETSAVSRNGLSLSIEAPAATVERAFDVSLERYAIPATATASARVGFIATAAPRLLSAISGKVQAVIGLDSLASAQPLGLLHAPRSPGVRSANDHAASTSGPKPCSKAQTNAQENGAYTANQMGNAYNFNGLYKAGDLGSGQTVALYELERNSLSDIAAFQSCYGTKTKISYIAVDGGVPGANTGQNDDGSGEAALDIEDVLSLAPAAKLEVYRGPNTNAGNFDLFNRMITDDSAQVISSSWGECEQDLGNTLTQSRQFAQSENTLFEEAATQGQTVLAASGDEGSEGCYGDGTSNDNIIAVGDPASQPFVTGVGGTSLEPASPPATGWVESVWNNGNGSSASSAAANGAGGGGVSSFWGMPAWQENANASLNVITSNIGGTGESRTGSYCNSGADYCREVPDVSADADPNYGYMIYWNGNRAFAPSDTVGVGWQAIGGTSAAAPLWAALIALTNASSACRSGNIEQSVGFVNPGLYIAAGDNYSQDFHDVTSGNNGTYSAETETGYDMASGLGSPSGTPLARDLCGGISVDVTNPGTQNYAQNADVSLPIADAGGTGSLTLTAAGLPSGLSLQGSAIAGTASTAGIYHVVLTATDSNDVSGVAKFTINVISPNPPTASPSISAPSGRKPKLFERFTAPAGTTLTRVTITLPASVSIGGGDSEVSDDISVRTAGGSWTGGTFTSHTLTLTFSGASSATVDLASPALRISSALASAIRRHHPWALKITTTVVETHASSGPLVSTLTL